MRQPDSHTHPEFDVGYRAAGERIQALEAERERYRSALRDLLGWIPVDEPEHLRISRLLRGATPEQGPFRFRDNARKGQR